MIRNIAVRRWASLILHHCCHRGRVQVAKYWSIIAKHKHVIEPYEHVLKIKILILQKSNDCIGQSIPNPHDRILGNVLVKNRQRSRVDMTVR